MSSNSAETGSGRIVLALIAGLPLTMIFAASWLWYFVVQGDLDLIGAIGTANNGALISPPRQIGETVFKDDAGAPKAWGDVEPRWTMVVASAGPECAEACERRLYTTRQIHIALGKDFKRVRRAFISDTPLRQMTVERVTPLPEGWPAAMDGNRLLDLTALGHKGLMPIQAEPAAFATLFPELAADSAQWYLVDPGGWIMMRFSDDLDYKAVISDLKFLLKNSGGK